MPEPELEAIEITIGHCLGGGKNIAEGTVLEVPRDITPAEAATKVTMRLAVPVKSARKKKAPAPANVENRDPAVASGDPAAVPAQPPTVRKNKKGKKGK